ncbi:hypothetical protein [Microcoleus vaginatus]|uniref:hypothetical protein n=1 Tax=Microcoleus vaginatus TaxID=119532 RepID=UPI001F61DC61|nr:hypothetical protein D0A37_26515 [Microcoleus vaginatus HSN003]
MSQKLMPRLGSAIASTILSLFSAVSLVGVDTAQAAFLTYNFQAEGGGGSGFFKVDNSSLTGIDFEGIAVSEGRLDTYLTISKDYYNLAGAIALFDQGEFLGLQASGGESSISIIPDESGAPYAQYETSASWRMENNGSFSLFSGEKYVTTIIFSTGEGIVDRSTPPVNYAPVSYTLVDTAAEPVPEPLTAGAAALALAGLSWLKHKKKMAV